MALVESTPPRPHFSTVSPYKYASVSARPGRTHLRLRSQLTMATVRRPSIKRMHVQSLSTLTLPANPARTPSSAPSSAPRTPHPPHPAAHISEILPRLYIADLSAAEDPVTLAALGITHVLSAMPGPIALPPALAGAAAQVPLHDAPFAELAAHLPRTTRYIARALSEGPDRRVLVHCAMGASRSVAVVCGYLIAAHGLSPAQALELVRARRAVAAPNRGFVDQLHEYYRSLQSEGVVLD